jgi:hypothetical protein
MIDATVFVVLARRWGDAEKHAYIVGAYRDIAAAMHACDEESFSRDGKYTCEVYAAPVLTAWEDSDELPTVVHTGDGRKA